MSTDISKAIDAGANILNTAPELYHDALQPSVKNTGKATETITGLINTILTPLEILNFVVKENKEKFMSSYHEKLNKIPEDKKINPRLEIAGPIIESLKYKITEDTLRETYAKLLACASDMSCSDQPLLSYNSILNQLSPKEVVTLRYLYSKERLPVVKLYAITNSNRGFSPLMENIIDNSFDDIDELNLVVIVSNLIRLGLVKTSYTEAYTDHSVYNYVPSSSIYKDYEVQLAQLRNNGEYPKLSSQKGILIMTTLGKAFCFTVMS